jgi:hypothetical protein
MSSDISLLPEGMRKHEETIKHVEPQQKEPAQDLRFSVPLEEGEDVEVIEIDEGEVDQVLAGEPLLTQVAFRVSSFIDGIKAKLMQPQISEPPPKLPPQFFKPPAPKPVPPPAPVVKPKPPTTAPSAMPAVAPPAPKPIAPLPASPVAAARPKPKARVIPSEKTPKRVRVIRRIRKPLHVSFVSEDDIRMLRVDVPKRQFTFFVMLSVFLVALVGGWFALSQLQIMANKGLTNVHGQLTELESQIAEKQNTWSLFTTLEPRLRALGTLLDAHVSPTSLLQRIEQITLPSVSYDSFTMTQDLRVSLSVSADSFEDAARQVVAFQKADFVKSVAVSGYSADYEADGSFQPKNVRFQITLQLSPTALQPPVVKAVAVTP